MPWRAIWHFLRHLSLPPRSARRALGLLHEVSGERRLCQASHLTCPHSSPGQHTDQAQTPVPSGLMDVGLSWLIHPLVNHPTHGERGRTGLLFGFLLQTTIGPGVGTSGAHSWFHISSSCERKMLRVVSVRYLLRSNSHGQQARSCASDKATNTLLLSLGSRPTEGNSGQRFLGGGLLHNWEKALLEHCRFTCWKHVQWGWILSRNIQRKLTLWES